MSKMSRILRHIVWRSMAVSLALGLSTLLAQPAMADVKIGFAMATSDKFQDILTDAMKSYSQSKGNVQLTVENGNNDAATQTQQVKSFIDQHMDAIIVAAIDETHTKVLSDMVAAAGIPLIYLNRRPAEDTFAGKVAIVTSNDLVAGRLQMRKLAVLMGGKGNLVILKGMASASAAAGRTQGVKEILAKYPDIKVIEEATADWDRQKAAELIAGWIAKGDQIDAVAANNDEMAVGAIAGFEKAGKSLDKVYIGGVDATPDALAAMKDGKLAVTVLQNAQRQAQQSIDDALKLVQGERAQQYDWVSYEMVTPQNLPTYMAH